MPGPITVLGGIQYGWENHCTKVNKKLSFGSSSADACDCSCDDPTATPEPATFMLTLGAFALLGISAKNIHASITTDDGKKH